MTRRLVTFAFWAVSLLSSSACLVSSLHPVYEDDAILFDELLLGDWENRESEVSASVSRGEWRSYQIAFTDRFGTTTFVGHLTTIGKARFLNVIPQNALETPPFIVATNGFMQIEINRDGVRVREPDYGVVLKRATPGKLRIHTVTDVKQNVILTASSSQVRAWLATALKDEALWADWKTFTRSAR
jgi:hypothetical protein